MAAGGSPGGLLGLLPDLLTLSRIALGPAFVVLLSTSPGAAVMVAAVAAVSDFVDGKLARRLGQASARGAILDVSSDAVFVLSALAALAWQGVLSPLLPLAAGISLAALARVWRRGGPARGPRALPDRIGHAAGVLNYGAAFFGAVVLAFDQSFSLVLASQFVALLNVLPLLLRLRVPR